VSDPLALIAHVQPSAEWLAASVEPALEPDLPIIDCHHHFSEHWGGYLLPELLADTGSGHRIEQTVYVQCGWHYRNEGAEAMRPIGETEAVVAIAAQSPARTRVAAGIVGYADLLLGDAIDEVLAAQVIAGKGRFRGVRNSGARHPAFRHGVLPRPIENLYAQPSFRRGYACLARHGLSFDAWIYHPQVMEVVDLARAFPETTLILDHAGVLGVEPYRGRRAQVLDEWLKSMRVLATCPNVQVKIGGLGTAVFGYDFSSNARPPGSEALADAWRPTMEPVIELFGAERCMFESNFPVDRAAAGYGVVWNAFKRLASGAGTADKAALFRDTAARVYRLADPA
jgi:predicted TIM-barrel fold metal-dependent hydrolase